MQFLKQGIELGAVFNVADAVQIDCSHIDNTIDTLNFQQQRFPECIQIANPALNSCKGREALQIVSLLQNFKMCLVKSLRNILRLQLQ